MAVKGKGVDRVYELIDVGFSLEFLIGSMLKFMPDDDIVEMLEDNELMEEPDELFEFVPVKEKSRKPKTSRPSKVKKPIKKSSSKQSSSIRSTKKTEPKRKKLKLQAKTNGPEKDKVGSNSSLKKRKNEEIDLPESFSFASSVNESIERVILNAANNDLDTSFLSFRTYDSDNQQTPEKKSRKRPAKTTNDRPAKKKRCKEHVTPSTKI